MGTRHLICVFMKGEYKIAQYGQWDGYPSGQGVRVLDFLRSEMKERKFKTSLKKVTWATNQELKAIEKNLEETNQSCSVLYPELSRDTGSKILSLIQDSKTPVKLVNQVEFAGDSLFCKYAYVIDFDKRTFEIYKGFNQKPLDPKERFSSIKQAYPEYHPVRLWKSYKLDKLPTENKFLKDLAENEKD